MNENNNEQQLNPIIYTYTISSNRDNPNTYSVEIETSVHTIVYSRANVIFGSNQAIAFPIDIQVLDKDDNVYYDYNLELKQQESSNQNPQNDLGETE